MKIAAEQPVAAAISDLYPTPDLPIECITVKGTGSADFPYVMLIDPAVFAEGTPISLGSVL